MSDETFPKFTTGQTLLLGLRCRCPRCGRGGLFSKYLKIADECSECHLGLHGHDVGDGPVVPAILVLGSLVVGLALYFEFAYEPPLWMHVVIWPPVIALLTGLTLPRLKGLAVAMQYKFRSTEEPGRLGGT